MTSIVLVCSVSIRPSTLLHYDLTYATNPLKETFAQKFFDVSNHSDFDSIQEYLLALDIKSDYLISIVSVLESEKDLLIYIKSKLVSFYPNLLYYMKEQKLYLLFHQANQDKIEEMLKQLVMKHTLYCGTSALFSSVKNRSQFIQQAQVTNELAQKLQIEGKVVNYSDYYATSHLMYSLAEFHPTNVLPASLYQLIEYDDKHQTDMMNTLRVYLFNRNDINQAAKELHLHRNSLIYRLNKIKDILKINIDDSKTAFDLQIGLEIFFQHFY